MSAHREETVVIARCEQCGLEQPYVNLKMMRFQVGGASYYRRMCPMCVEFEEELQHGEES